MICRKFSFILDAGISVKRAMDMLSKQSNGRVKTAVNTVLIFVKRGDSLSTALSSAKVFPTLLCGLAAMGETSGRLPEVIKQAADYYEQRAETKNELAGAVAYPALVSLLMLMVMILAVTFVLPSYAQVFEASDVDLPFLTNALIRLSNVFAEQWHIIFIGFLVLTIFFIVYFNTGGRIFAHGFLLRLPPYRIFINAQLSQALALTLSAGQNLTEALPLCVDILQNKVVKRDLRLTLMDVSAGMPLHKAIAKMKYADILLTDMIRVGEETGMLPQTMAKCRTYFGQSYSRGMKRLNKLIEPALTIILGALLGALMLSVILPTFRLADVGW